VSHPPYSHRDPKGWGQLELKEVNSRIDLNLKSKNVKTFEINTLYIQQ
jgi:hypothetical protein